MPSIAATLTCARCTQGILCGKAGRGDHGTVYGYDPSATLNDAATLNNTTRNDATDNDSTHDDLATPTTTTRPTLNGNAD